VDAYLDANGGVDAVLSRSLSDLPTTRERVRDYLIAAEIGQRVTPGLAVTIDMLFVASRDEAEQVTNTLAAGGPAADALFTPERDPRLDATFQAASNPNEASTVVFGVPVGTVGFFPLDGGEGQWLVFHVVDRRTDMPSDPAAIGSISQSQLASIGQRVVQPDGEALGIRVNPRYGAWDPVQSLVVPEGQQGGEIVLPPAPPAG
jgi:hypothetical protein